MKKRLIQEGEDVELHEEEVPYTPLSNLGFGAHGFVEKVRDVNTGACYARKTFRTDRVSLDQAKSMLRREVEIIRELASHPHIIQIHATYISGRTLAIILQPVADGGNLAQFLSQCRDTNSKSHFLSRQRARKKNEHILRRAIGCLARCLAYIHGDKDGRKSIVRHKDIKPGNILLHKGYAILTDFGISKRCVDDISNSTGRPDLFTARYCAPEVADFDDRNRKADVFSLGCVFYEIYLVLSGSPRSSQTFKYPQEGEAYHHCIEDMQHILLGNCLLDFSRPKLATKKMIESVIREMIHREPSLRPSAADVAESIQATFCDKCDEFASRSSIRAGPTLSGFPTIQNSRTIELGNPSSALQPLHKAVPAPERNSPPSPSSGHYNYLGGLDLPGVPYTPFRMRPTETPGVNNAYRPDGIALEATGYVSHSDRFGIPGASFELSGANLSHAMSMVEMAPCELHTQSSAHRRHNNAQVYEVGYDCTDEPIQSLTSPSNY